MITYGLRLPFEALRLRGASRRVRRLQTVLWQVSIDSSIWHMQLTGRAEARAKTPKELLTSRKFSISEVAHQLGFADQSHLTHYVKRFYGVTLVS